MRVIGLTGGIACGKSNVSEALRKTGIPVVDADEISRELTAPNGAALEQIREEFGDTVFLEDGTLNRKALGNLVFHDPQSLKKLNAILHPMIYREIMSRLEALRENGEKLCVLEAPLLFETKMNRLCNTVWCVVVPYREQIRRLMARDNLTKKQAAERIHSQYPGWLRSLRSDVRINSEGTHEETQQKALQLLQREWYRA